MTAATHPGPLRELLDAVGDAAAIRSKLRGVAQIVWASVTRGERQRRLERLRDRGFIAAIPTDWQMIAASWDMLTGFIIPSNAEFYEHYDRNQYWLQLLRALDQPTTMLDPTGLAISQDDLVLHLVHVVHCSAGYDVGLLEVFDDGLDDLERQLEQVVAGTHPKQASIERTLERPTYPAELLAAVRLYRQDPDEHWRVVTFPPPEGTQELFDSGIERYGSIGRLLTHALTLPPTPWASLRARF